MLTDMNVSMAVQLLFWSSPPTLNVSPVHSELNVSLSLDPWNQGFVPHKNLPKGVVSKGI